MTSREENVLVARDPSVEDENEWEEFSLTDVKILIPGKSRYANLLTVSSDNPVRVIGCLDEVEEEQESLVLDDDYLSKRIVIENVTHYAYGQHDDGEVGIWVAGKAGWYSIVPARGYLPMYNDMVEAIDLLYFLVDRLQRTKRKRRSGGPTFEYLCDEYVTHTHGICEDGDDSAEVFDKHHRFLLSQMIRSRENVQWTETSIFEYLRNKFPEEYERLEELHKEKEAMANGENEVEAETADLEAVAKAQADTIFSIILDLKEAGALAKRQLNIELVANTLQRLYEVPTIEYARELITARAPTLTDLMDQAKTSSFDWSKKAIYRELKTVSSGRNDIHQYAATTPLHRRSATNDDDEDDSENESESDDRPRKGRKRGSRMSILRPKLSTVSAKKARKHTRRTTTADEMDMSEDESEPDPDLDTPSKSRDHEFVREPPTSNPVSKRRAGATVPGLGTRTVLPFQQRRRKSSQSNSHTHESSEPSDEDEEANHDHSMHDNVWVCSVSGCGKIIPKANSKRSQAMIRDHSLVHAEDTQSKLDIVFAEQRLNVGYGVDHLLSRIREFGTQDNGGVASDALVGHQS